MKCWFVGCGFGMGKRRERKGSLFFKPKEKLDLTLGMLALGPTAAEDCNVHASESQAPVQELQVKNSGLANDRLRMLQLRELAALLLAWLAVCVCVSAAETDDSNVKTVPLYFKPASTSVGSATPIKKGLLKYDVFLGTGEFKELGSKGIEGLGCFGIVDAQAQFKCLAYAQVDTRAYKQENFTVYIDKHGGIENLAYLRSKVSANEGDGEIGVAIVESASVKGPVPLLAQPVQLVDGQVPEEEVRQTNDYYGYDLILTD